MTVDRILSAGWAATYDGDEATLEMTATVQGGSEAVVEAQQYDIYCWAEDRAVDSRGYARPNYMTHSYATTGVGNGSVPSGGKIEAVWVTDSTPPSMLFVAAEGVKTEDTLQVVLQLNEPGTVWCQVAEPLTAASSVYCREDDISSDPSAQCYWETFMKGSVALGTSFSAEVPLPFTYVRVEMNRIWQKGLTQGDPLLPETEYKIFCLAEDDWPSQAQASDLTSVYFNASSLSPQRSTLPQVVAFKDAAGTRSTLDLSPPNLTVTSVGTTEQQITVLATLSEPGTAWCRAVRRGFAIPTLLEILAADFSVPLLVAPYNGTVTMTSESGVGAAWSVPLVRGTDYEVYCYAEDDSCVGCQQPSGIDTAAIAATLTSVRTMDTTPPQLTAVDLRSIARDTIQVTLQADEGSRVWCAAWSTLSESDLNASNYEANIKNWEGTCKDSWGRDCGSFWVYDMDDLEDTTLDGMSSEDDYRHYQTWRHHEDVTIVLSGLLESTEYGYIYCFAEDDEPDGAGSVPNKMSFDVGVDASQVSKLQEALGNVTTLDETPPSFTELLIQDPTAWNDRIEVTFALNEPGTAYCRATRSDSGEVEEDMYIGWIQTAQWSSAHDGSAAPSSIVITALENSDDSARLNAPIQEAHQYDVYCWALDSAVDTAGFPRANLMQQSYVVTESNSTSSPLGGKTKGVWVVDTTPPTMILVHAEAISAVELQVILQLDEPGTVWCQPSDMAGIATQCQSMDIQNESASADCYWLNFIQGNNFRAEVHEAFVDYSINMNLLYPIGSNASEALTSESQYEVFCYAEDDWSDQANGAPLSSVNFVTQSLRNAVSFADANVVRTSIGVQRTLDTSPPSFTMLAIEDPTVANDRIVVTFTLNEPGTAYCRPTRSDSGQTAADMTLHRILSAGWFAGHDGGTSASSITISKLENAVEAVPIYEASQYDIYCAAKDTAVDSKGFAIPNWMSFSYIANAIGSPSTPSGGFTSNVWVVDSTPPELILVDVFAPSESSLQIRLQLNEPGTVWCAPVEVENSTFCTFEDISNVSGSPCDYESFIQGDAMLQAVFYAEVSEAHKDVDIKMDRIMTRDGQQSYPLEHQHQYWIFCFAEDDWPLQAAAGMNSSNFVAPAEANRISLRTAQDFANLTGLITTLDQSPPSFSFLHIEDPTVANDRLHVIFALNEPGTAYCRAVRLDSGETPADMSITRILTAQWMASNDGMSNSSIEITQLENVDPRLTGRDDQVVPIVEATQYDVYCWAQDTAVDSYGYPKSNYMDIEYVRTDVQSSTEPQGGRSPGVWVVDTTPPSMTLVRAEGISGDTLQVTLQLDEPGTVWCAAVQMGSDLIYCLPGTVASGGSFSASAGLCEYETLIKGDTNASFSTEVPQAFSSVQVEVSRILRKDLSAADALTSETAYHVYCFAEDDWPSDAQGAARRSQSYVSHPAEPNKVTLEDVLNFSSTFSSPTTLDVSPPSFTLLQVQDPTALNTQIEVVFALNEAGTAYCRPLRSDSAEAAKAMDLNVIISAGWSARHDPLTSENSSIIMTGTRPLKELDEAKQYDVYCWAQDEAKTNFGYPRPQYMTQAYVGSDVGVVNAPSGGKTSKVWVVDSTAPRMLFAAWDAIRDEETLQVTLQLDEPGTVWCQAALNVSTSGFCAETELQDSDPQADCYYESYIKGNSTAVFRKEVPEAFRDVEVEVNRLPSRDGSFAPVPLEPKTGYKIVCFAEDDWVEEAQSGSINFVAPLVANKVSLGTVLLFTESIGMATTLDLTAPNLTIHSTATTEDVIMVSVSLDEAGTVWCRALRKNSRSAYEAPEIVATGFLVEVQSGSVDQVNITAENVKGDALARGTDYEVYCFARDVLCLGCDAPSGSSTQAIQASRTFVRTADATPPRIYVMYAESISHDTIQLTLQMDEGSKLWCGAWEAEPTGMSTDFESLIKEANCSESRAARPCGSFWIYDLDDVEDTALDGVSSLSDYADAYRIGHDVQLSITGLKEKTDYAYIYCFAEDDETDGLGSSPNKMSFDATSAATTDARSLVASVSTAIGAVQTLDETPPSFTELSVVDPTASEGVIVVSFALNEPGTAYCRATRSDSGETGSEMHPNRIIAAGWSAAQGGPGFPTANISLTQLRSDVPYDVQPVEIYSSTQYDVYCWAKDDATTTAGFDRRNYMSQSYVSTAVGDPMLPLGGATLGVWVDDSTPPTMRFISAEAISRDTIQVTLQLDEPGTIWCAAAELDSSSELQNCRESEVQDTEPNDAITPCYYETFIKGSSSENVVFSHEVHDAFRDVDIEVNRIWQRDRNGSSTLLPETSYRIFCFAEDNWVLKTTASVVSPNFVAPSLPNKSPFSQVQELTAAIGTRTTLDEDPPSFTSLTIPNPTASNDRILVIFALNEPGTAYCRARRVDVEPGESMHIPDILAAGWWASYDSGLQNITMTQISRPDPSIGALEDETAPFDEQQQYDVFCWAHDDAVNGRGLPRRNGQTEDYVNHAVGQTKTSNSSLPGGKTSGVWVVDITPPSLLLVQAEALSPGTLQVRLQLDEPGTVWCAATEVLSGTVNCQDSELQENNPLAACYFQDYIKGNLSSSFQVEVHEAFQDVDVEVNRILQKDMAGDAPLELQTTYQVFCYAEDDWKIQADSASNSADYVSPAGPQGSSLQSVQSFAQSMGQLSTLDEAPPSFTVLEIQDPTAAEGILVISFALNEVGTAYCRVTRSDSGETAADMQINRVLTANWNAVYDGSSNATITMNNLENVNPLLTNREDEVAPLVPGQQYDVYCWGKDSANTTFGYSRPNYMTSAYVSTAVTSPTAPLGGYTKGVWIADTTPPSMLLTSLDALSDTQILVTLQLDEPGTVWCAATVPDSGSSSYCRPSDLQDTDNTAQCYYEDYIKGSVAQGTRFETQVPQAYVDVYVEVNRIALATGTGSPLPAETQFVMLCFAQDNWDLRTQAAYANGDGSPNFVAPLPNKVTLAEVNSFIAATVASGQSALTLDLTAPTATARSLYAPTSSESSLEVLFSVDEASTLYCLAVFSGEATPHVSTVAIEGQSQNCSAASFDAGACSGLILTLPDLLRGQSYDVHCHLEDDNIYPLVPNRNVLPLLTAQVNDLTPPQLSVVRASAAEPNQITVTLQMDEPGTVWCFSPTAIGQLVSSSWVFTHGAASKTLVGDMDVNKNFEVSVAVRGTLELPLDSETAYETYCGAEDRATNPDCTGCTVPNVNTLTEMGAVRDSIGQIITRDVDAPIFDVLGVRGVSDSMLTVTLQLNEPGTAYCRATRTDSGSTHLDVSLIVQAGYLTENDGSSTSSIDINKLRNHVDEPLLTEGTAYDVYCWAKDSAQVHACRPSGSSVACSFEDAPNYMVQSYVETRFAELVHAPDLASVANGGLVDMVRTWDITPPVLAVIEVESRSEDSITVTLQLDEPGTAYCAAYQVDPGANVTFADVFAATGGPFSFDIPSDSALRSFSASAFRNFQITVTGLAREVLYYVYCAAEDDEFEDGCFQRNSTESPTCGNNEGSPVLTEATGRYTLDLTPPSITVVDAVSYTQDSVTVTVSMDEAGTVWCTAVLDLQPPPSISQIVALGFKSPALAGSTDVVIQGLNRDTEYDVYCFAQDDGTMSAQNSSLEVRLSKKNAIGYTEMVATKMDAHVIYDSTAPLLVSTTPVHNAAGVAELVNISLTFDEDIQAGNGTVQILGTGTVPPGRTQPARSPSMSPSWSSGTTWPASLARCTAASAADPGGSRCRRALCKTSQAIPSQAFQTDHIACRCEITNL
ncbi:unnamed protein product [Durusdinium trenchii]|uniref:SbsA Ig-like domain-containing protein n=1 Tax=Durusdinium trenchii TaxID=1381693 RepID=A0ABP0HXL5_9DINO